VGSRQRPIYFQEGEKENRGTEGKCEDLIEKGKMKLIALNTSNKKEAK
jgi:hypothetical protein